MAQRLVLTKADVRKLRKIVAKRTARAEHARRARIILLLGDGMSAVDAAKATGTVKQHISRVKRRFMEGGVDGLADKAKAGRKDHAVKPETAELLVQTALSPPPAGRSRWTTRLLGRQVKLTSGAVSKVLRAKGLKPHLTRTYKVSRDPAFAAKVEDVVGLYLKPPRNALVISLDEKTGIQALQRTQLPLPMRRGRAATHTHDYKRNGVLDLYAALEIRSGRVTHACTDSHTGTDFIAFMNRVVKDHPKKKLHVILDNSSTHSTADVAVWLKKNPRVKFHYTPTSASWLNQVEGFFGILSKQSLHVTDFPSKTALRKHIDAFMKDWNKNPTEFCWTKPAKAIIESHQRMVNRISKAVH
jgi:transposase